jgi:cysteine-rich repeat protein
MNVESPRTRPNCVLSRLLVYSVALLAVACSDTAGSGSTVEEGGRRPVQPTDTSEPAPRPIDASQPDAEETDLSGDVVADDSADQDSESACGDGEQGPDEGCDDGNVLDGDGCSSTCETESNAALCRPCDSPSDCGDATMVCAELQGAGACLLSCTELDECPEGFSCVASTLCLPLSRSCATELCSGGIDEDGDGDVDCADSDCSEDPACDEAIEISCTNAIDDDGDLLVDCADDECASSADCVESICDDALDNDNDGKFDCSDTDCDGAVACAVAAPEICTGGVDEDLDGAIDCDDSDCVRFEACATFEDCINGIDDDRDSAVDCADSDCAGHPSCGTGVACTSTIPVVAPGTFTGNTAGAPSTIQIDPTNSCWITTYGYSIGSNRIYEVRLPAGATLSASLTPDGWLGNPSLYVLQSCTPSPSLGYCTEGWGACVARDECLAAASSAAPSLTYQNITRADQSVYVVIDGHTAFRGPYTLVLGW